MSAIDQYEVYAIKYAECTERTRRDSFIFDAAHDVPHDLDFFIWVVRNRERTILIDTGFDADEGAVRGRPILYEPAQALAAIGVSAESIDAAVITHLHFDHAGGLDQFPNARFHLQEAEMAYATGPCMCHPVLQHPFTADHVCNMVRRVYDGKVIFHDGDAEIAPGVSVHKVGGHSRGLQAVRVATANGPLVLASDAAHYYENYETRSPFPLVVDVEDMLKGFDLLAKLAGERRLVIPGHDPLVRQRFPRAFEDAVPDVRRLDLGMV
jgi:glyoxylase-like metal-dependent hydrolase (beta-lactamase superfamily II)